MVGMKEMALNFGPQGQLVGVLTRPSGSSDRPDRPAVIFLNAGILHRIGPNRVHVRLARHLTKQGFPSLRMDLPGVGDSGTLGTGLSLQDESREAVVAAIDLLKSHGVATRFILFGLCSGADTAFQVACQDSRVVGLAIIDPTHLFPTWKTWMLRLARTAMRPVAWGRLLAGRYDVVRQLRRRFGWEGRDARREGAPDQVLGRDGVSVRLNEDARELASRALAELVRRDVRICHMITGDQRNLYNYRTQLLDAFPEVRLREVTRLELFPEAQHTFPRPADRDALEDTLSDWVFREWSTEAGHAAFTPPGP